MSSAGFSCCFRALDPGVPAGGFGQALSSSLIQGNASSGFPLLHRAVSLAHREGLPSSSLHRRDFTTHDQLPHLCSQLLPLPNSGLTIQLQLYQSRLNLGHCLTVFILPNPHGTIIYPCGKSDILGVTLDSLSATAPPNLSKARRFTFKADPAPVPACFSFPVPLHSLACSTEAASSLFPAFSLPTHSPFLTEQLEVNQSLPLSCLKSCGGCSS